MKEGSADSVSVCIVINTEMLLVDAKSQYIILKPPFMPVKRLIRSKLSKMVSDRDVKGIAAYLIIAIDF